MSTYTITQTQIDAIADTYNDDITPTTDYSGRGMYGDRCVGFTVDSVPLLMYVIGYLTDPFWDNDNDDAIGPDLGDWMAHHARTDNMGLQTIVYWPGLTVADDEGGAS